MEQFFQSMARAFARNQIEPGDVLTVGLVAIVLAAGTWVAVRLRSQRNRTARLQRLAELRGLNREDLRCLETLAARVGTDSVALTIHPELFERATVAELQDGTTPAGESQRTQRIHHIRLALGFDRVAQHAPLLSTRQLPPGTTVELGSNLGEIVASGESAFEVALRWRPALVPDQQVRLALIRPGEARYALSCRLLAIEPGAADAWRLVLSHDERPVRVQQRQYARASVHAGIVIRQLGGGAEQRLPEVQGQLIDVSGGGALAAVPARLAIGERVNVSFAVAGQLFTNLGAVVRSSSDPLRGQSRVQLEFTEVTDHQRDRLVAAVMRLELERRDQKVDLVWKRELGGPARGGRTA